MREQILQVNHLQVSFRTGAGLVRAVRDISFTLEKGRTLAIVGESGSGKSVTSRAIMGLLAPNALVEGGEILYKGRDLLKMPEKELCKLRGNKIAMIFQDPLTALDPIMPIGKQIAETMIIHQKMSRTDAKNKAIKLMEEVGIRDAKTRYDKYPFAFSGGMRQRIVIAIALAADPEILICDEPTTALDVTIQAQILELLGKLKEERHLSMIFITHDLGVVANVADHIAVMYAGKIVEQGDAEALFHRPRHPYTWGLLSSVPRLDAENKEALVPITGTPPDLIAPPVGCPFAARCVYSMGICRKVDPSLTQVGDSATHRCACWLLHPDAPKVEMPENLRKRGEN